MSLKFIYYVKQSSKIIGYALIGIQGVSIIGLKENIC